MSRKSRDKGKRGEREAAKLLSSLLDIEATRGVQFQGSPESPDVSGLQDMGLHPEVKRDETTVSKAMYRALAQAGDDSGERIPFVMSRRNGSAWVIAINASDLVEFCKRIAHEK